MPSIFIYNYNNYYNRKVKKEDSLEKYGSPIYIETGNNVNFNPSDGVNTYYDAGRINNSYDGHGDYLIYSEDNVSVTSRWFITEADRLRKGQYRCVLRRDVLVDYYPQVVSSPCYIEKALINDINNPLLFNREAIQFNQIKTDEFLLKDATNCPWVVGYIPRSFPIQGKEIVQKYADYDPNAIIQIDSLTEAGWSDYKYYANTLINGAIQDTYYGYATKADLITKYATTTSQTTSISTALNYAFTIYKNGIGVRPKELEGYTGDWPVNQVWTKYITRWSKWGTDGEIGFNSYIKTSFDSSFTSEWKEPGFIWNKFENFNIKDFNSTIASYLDVNNEGQYSGVLLNRLRTTYDNKIIKDKSTGLSYLVKVVIKRNRNVGIKLTKGTNPFNYLDSRL